MIEYYLSNNNEICYSAKTQTFSSTKHTLRDHNICSKWNDPSREVPCDWWLPTTPCVALCRLLVPYDAIIHWLAAALAITQSTSTCPTRGSTPLVLHARTMPPTTPQLHDGAVFGLWVTPSSTCTLKSSLSLFPIFIFLEKKGKTLSNSVLS